MSFQTKWNLVKFLYSIYDYSLSIYMPWKILFRSIKIRNIRNLIAIILLPDNILKLESGYWHLPKSITVSRIGGDVTQYLRQYRHSAYETWLLLFYFYSASFTPSLSCWYVSLKNKNIVTIQNLCGFVL